MYGRAATDSLNVLVNDSFVNRMPTFYRNRMSNVIETNVLLDQFHTTARTVVRIRSASFVTPWARVSAYTVWHRDN